MVIGSVFIAQAVAKGNWLREAMQEEQITLGLSEEDIAQGNVVDTAPEAQQAADIIKEHHSNIAPTYGDLLGGGRYDPTNPKHLSHAQVLNLENSLGLAVLGFGVSTMALGSGVFRTVSGVGLACTGLPLA